MLRQDFTVLQIEPGDGPRVEIGGSLILLAFVMVHVLSGVMAFLEDLAVFVVIVFSLFLREAVRARVIEALGLRLFSVRLSGGGGHADYSRASLRDEETIAAIGPMVSLALWAMATIVLWTLPDGSAAARWVEIFAFVNLFIGIFTALPVQPNDGGRFLYLWLSRTISVPVARRVCGGIGLLLSVVWLPASLLAFLIFGMVLIALPSVSEHWAMLTRGAPAVEG